MSKEHCIPNEQLSILDTFTLEKDTGIFSQDNNGHKIVTKQPIAKGIPQEFTLEVCIQFLAKAFYLFSFLNYYFYFSGVIKRLNYIFIALAYREFHKLSG